METDRNIYIKNMVCDRCVMVVRSVLERLGLTPLSVELGRAELSAPLAETARQDLREALAPLGFELIDDPRIRTVEHIKRLIIELVHHQDNQICRNTSPRSAATITVRSASCFPKRKARPSKNTLSPRKSNAPRNC
jgi:hypothetical protein